MFTRFHNINRAVTSLALASALLVMWSEAAGPCSCAIGRFPQFLVPTDVTMPANARGIPCAYLDSRARISIARLNDDSSVDFKVEPVSYPTSYASMSMPGTDKAIGEFNVISLIRPDWRPGESYRVTIDNKSIVVHSSPDSLEESSGDIQIWDNSDGSLTTMTLSGMCSTSLQAHKIGIELFGEIVDRWKNALLFLTVVDGKTVWAPKESLCSSDSPGISWVGRARELVYCDCTPKESREAGPTWCLSPGKHTVTMIAWLPGVMQVSTSETVVLGCP